MQYAKKFVKWMKRTVKSRKQYLKADRLCSEEIHKAVTSEDIDEALMRFRNAKRLEKLLHRKKCHV